MEGRFEYWRRKKGGTSERTKPNWMRPKKRERYQYYPNRAIDMLKTTTLSTNILCVSEYLSCIIISDVWRPLCMCERERAGAPFTHWSVHKHIHIHTIDCKCYFQMAYVHAKRTYMCFETIHCHFVPVPFHHLHLPSYLSHFFRSHPPSRFQCVCTSGLF